jgi:hypothetical protein
MVKLVVLGACAVVLSGCATTSSVPMGPNGRPMHHIEGVGATAAYKKAAEKCPGGYDVVHSRQQGIFFVIDAECK